jgi:hypothetical protein
MFYKALSLKESSNNQYAVNQCGYLGLYQMGTLALTDTGYIKNKKWTGKYNIYSKEDFLNSSKVQNISVREYHKIIWEKYLQNYHKYIGEKICGITLCKASMIAASHLVGACSLKKFIDTNGTVNKCDANRTTCLNYLKYFENYEIDYSLELV